MRKENNGWTKIEDAYWLKSELKDDGGRRFWVDGSNDDSFIFVVVEIIEFPNRATRSILPLSDFLWLTTEDENHGLVPTHYRFINFEEPIY